MHTRQLFPAVCFWKNLIPDAVKYWFSLTSVKALIFLLRLNNLSNNIFFFAFLGFHKWWHAHLPFTLPCLRPCLPPVPKLWLLLLLFQISSRVARARNMSIGGASALLRNIQNIRICLGKKTYRFCNLRKWKDLNKKQLTLLKICVIYVLCGFLCKQFSLYIKVNRVMR